MQDNLRYVKIDALIDLGDGMAPIENLYTVLNHNMERGV